MKEAYQTGQLKGHQITDAKRLIEKRRQNGPKSESSRAKLPASTYSLVKAYQKEVARQHSMVLKTFHCQTALRPATAPRPLKLRNNARRDRMVLPSAEMREILAIFNFWGFARSGNRICVRF